MEEIALINKLPKYNEKHFYFSYKWMQYSCIIVLYSFVCFMHCALFQTPYLQLRMNCLLKTSKEGIYF